jgi:hypothetical protein
MKPNKSLSTNQGTIQASVTSKSYKSIRPKNIQAVQLPKTSNFYDEPSKDEEIVLEENTSVEKRKKSGKAFR